MNILLIEDTESVFSTWQDQLEANGHEVHIATTPEKALTVFRERNWDIIVLDGCIGGHEFNCLPVLKEIRKSFSGPIVAASSDEELRASMMIQGCTHESPKPYVLAELRGIIDFELSKPS